jgi:hypothetical protein
MLKHGAYRKPFCGRRKVPTQHQPSFHPLPPPSHFKGPASGARSYPIVLLRVIYIYMYIPSEQRYHYGMASWEVEKSQGTHTHTHTHIAITRAWQLAQRGYDSEKGGLR